MSEKSFFELSVGSGVSLIDEGVHDAVLIGIVQEGVHVKQFKGKDKPPAMQVKLIFEIPSITYEHDGQVLSKVIGRSMPMIIAERANFFKFFKAMGIMKEPTKEEAEKLFSTKDSVINMLGTSVSLTVEHRTSKDNDTFNVIESVSKLDPRLPQPESKRKHFVFSLNSPDLEVFKNDLTPYSRHTIMNSLSAKSLPKEFHEAYIAEQEAIKNKKSEDEIL